MLPTPIVDCVIGIFILQKSQQINPYGFTTRSYDAGNNMILLRHPYKIDYTGLHHILKHKYTKTEYFVS